MKIYGTAHVCRRNLIEGRVNKFQRRDHLNSAVRRNFLNPGVNIEFYQNRDENSDVVGSFEAPIFMHPMYCHQNVPLNDPGRPSMSSESDMPGDVLNLRQKDLKCIRILVMEGPHTSSTVGQ